MSRWRKLTIRTTIMEVKPMMNRVTEEKSMPGLPVTTPGRKLTVRLNGRQVEQLIELQKLMESKTINATIVELISKAHRGWKEGWGARLLK
jgi:hypothetical protein